jgi:hypothetical protein
VELAAADEVIFTGEGPEAASGNVRGGLGEWPRRNVVLYSSHDTLERDCLLAERLRGMGHAASSQSRTCVPLGRDKLRMKEFFDRHGFLSPAWARAGGTDRLATEDLPVVVKRRHGTQSLGMRLARLPHCALAADELCKLYLDGVEYSTLVYRGEGREVVFPPVWKGATSMELIPPWRRPRLCPSPGLAAETERRLRSISVEIARAADGQGYIEVEYLVTPAGAVHVLEINPRIAGTMRIAAMATAVPIFSIQGRPELRGDLEAVRCAGEVPYSGPPFSDPENGVFATSRLTVSAGSVRQVREKLERVRQSAGATT